MELVLMLIGLLVITAAAGVIIETILRRRDRRVRKGGHYDYPFCGKCGYNVHAHGSSRCPECGAQLRAVGVEWRRE